MSKSPPVKNALQNTGAETVDAVLPVALIDGHERNYNQHPEAQVKRLAKSVEKFGQVRGIVCQWQPSGRYLCLAGHGVLAGMKLAGKETARVALVPDSWSPAKCLAYLAADNELGRGAVADAVALEALVQEVALSDEDLAMLAAGSEEALAAMLAPGPLPCDDVPDVDPDSGDELQQKWRTQSRQLWMMGRHRLMIGDSTDAAVRAAALMGATPVAWIYDPEWDNAPVMPWADSRMVFTDGGRIGEAVAMHGPPRWLFVWDCVTSWYVPGQPLRRGKVALWYGHNAYSPEGSHYGEPGESKTVTNSRGSYEYEADPRGKHLSDVFQRPITQEHKDGHNHGKPLDWMRMLIANCLPTGLLFDPFAGGGASLLACEQIGRDSVCIEICPKSAAMILERWASAGLPTPTLHLPEAAP